MLIDSRIHNHEKFRKFTVIGSIAYAVSLIKKGETVEIDGILDFSGSPIETEKTRMGLHKVQEKLGIKCISRVKNGKLNITVI